MRKIACLLALVLVLGILGGCAGTTVVYTNCTCPSEGHAQTQTNAPCTCPAGSHVVQPVSGAVKTGLAVVATVSGTNAGEADGKVEYDVTLVAVLVDDNGVIQDCVIDGVATSVQFDTAGALVTDVNVAKALVEDYMEEHKDHLPQYAK